MLWRMFCEPHLDRIGIMLARLDDLPQRHRSGHCTRPRLEFRTSMRCEEFPVATIQTRAVLLRAPATPSHRHWHIACGNCGNYKIPAAAAPRWAARLAYRLRKLRELQDPGVGGPAPVREVGISLAAIAGITRSRRRPPRAGRKVGVSLAEIAGTTRSWQQPSRAGLEIGKTLAGTAETPAMARPLARIARQAMDRAWAARGPAVR